MEKQIVAFKNEQDLAQLIATHYMKAIKNFFGNEEQALEFATNIRASVQRVPKLLECTPESLLNSFMTMASLKLMPSGVSGEAYVLPYENKKKGITEAQFQLGYQGLITLFYRAGARSIVSEIVHEKDFFEYLNGEVKHIPDVFADDRGEAKGAYVIVELQTGGKVSKVMSKKEILDIAQKFSKSYGGFGPWSEGQDPQRWMWRKTVLKQIAKLVPKNETIYRAIAEDNKDSIISDKPSRIESPAPSPVDLTAAEEALRNCMTLEDLERVWADMPGAAKVSLKHVLERMKAILITESKDIT